MGARLTAGDLLTFHRAGYPAVGGIGTLRRQGLCAFSVGSPVSRTGPSTQEALVKGLLNR